MNKIIHCFIVLGLIFTLYVAVVNPILIDYMAREDNFLVSLFDNRKLDDGQIGNLNVGILSGDDSSIENSNESNIIDAGSSNDDSVSGEIVSGDVSSGGDSQISDKDNNSSSGITTYSTISSSGNTERFNRICSFDEDGWVWCHQNPGSQYLGFKDGCLLTSYAMLIINAGRQVGTEKNYDPVDVYLANNYAWKKMYPNRDPWDRKISAYHWPLFNYGFNASLGSITDIGDKSDSYKINKVEELLSKYPWGVVIGGKYINSKGNESTHYVVARYDAGGNLVFDDPAFYGEESIKNRKGAKISSISNVSGINSWSKINSIYWFSPRLTNGVWNKGEWENLLTDLGDVNPCYITTDTSVCYANNE